MSMTPPTCSTAASRLRPPRMWLFSGAGLAALALVSSAAPPACNTPSADIPEAPVMLVETTPAAPSAKCKAVNPMDAPLQILAEARQVYATIQDYSCLLIQKEKMGNQPPVENVMNLRVRVEPFSVNLKWLEPKALAGQEAVYVTGKNSGRMRVKSAGVLGAMGFLSLDANDARAKATSKHSITEAGIGALLERYVSGWENERQWNLTQVHIGEYEFDKHRCVRVETTHPDNPDGRFLYYRNVVYFDKETKLPVRVECYDWPPHEGDKPELLEMYSYTNIKLNVNLTADVFNK